MRGSARTGRRTGRTAAALTALALAAALAAAGVPALLAGCGGKGKEGAPAARTVVSGVEIVTVALAPREAVVTAVGTVRARTVAAVSPQVMGRITGVFVAEGSRVEKGALLAAIDDASAKAQVASAEGAVAEAASARAEADRAAAQAEAAKALAEKTYERFRILRDEKVITGQEFDEIEARRTVAVKEHERALEKRAQADARIRQAEGAADAARTALSHARLTAPFAGIVTEKRAEGGAMAVPGVPLFVLEDTARYRIEAAVPETLLPAVRKGSRVEAAFDAAPGRTIAAVVSEIVPAVDPASRTFTVKADVSGPGMRTGMSGTLRIPAGTAKVIAVPRRAVTDRAGYDGVFVVTADNVARLAPVRTGSAYGDHVEILSGLSAGDRVALAPLDRLADGVAVELRK